MPLYEYQCQECGKRFEVMLKMSDAHKLPPCPECNAAATRKLISSVSDLRKNTAGSSASSASCGSGGRFT